MSENTEDYINTRISRWRGQVSAAKAAVKRKENGAQERLNNAQRELNRWLAGG